MNKHICKNIYSYQDISRTDKHCSFIGHWQGSALPPRYAHVSAEATSHGGRQRRSWWLQGFQLQPDPAPVWPNLFWRSNPLGFVCNIGYIMVYLESIYIIYIYKDPKSPIQLLVIIMFIHFRYHLMAIKNDGCSIIFVDTPMWPNSTVLGVWHSRRGAPVVLLPLGLQQRCEF